MNKFTLLVFAANILLVGCAASEYLMNAPEPSPEKEIRQTLESWMGTHISQAIQKWGSPHEITGEAVGPKIYIWQTLSSSNAVYEFIFYTRSNGVIHKTDTRRYRNPIRESDWKEKHISKAIREWGTPHGITDDGTGSKIYIWQIPAMEFSPREYNRNVSRQRQTNGLQSIVGTSVAASDTYEFMFYTDPKGVIYKIFTKRDMNPSAGSRSSHAFQEKPKITQ